MAREEKKSKGQELFPQLLDLDGCLRKKLALREDCWNTSGGPTWRDEASDWGGEVYNKPHLLYNLAHCPLMCKHHFSVPHIISPEEGNF